MSAAYISEKAESELKLAYWRQKWEIVKEILKTKERNGSPTQTEDKIIEDLKSFTKKENQWGLMKFLRERAPPEQLNKIRYQRFKETASLILKYETEDKRIIDK